MLKLIRYWLPAALCIGGIVVIIAGAVSEPALYVGIPVFSAGASIWLLNFLYRVGVSGDKDRGVEDDARAYYAKHGEWPVDPGATSAPGGSR